MPKGNPIGHPTAMVNQAEQYYLQVRPDCTMREAARITAGKFGVHHDTVMNWITRDKWEERFMEVEEALWIELRAKLVNLRKKQMERAEQVFDVIYDNIINNEEIKLTFADFVRVSDHLSSLMKLDAASSRLQRQGDNAEETTRERSRKEAFGILAVIDRTRQGISVAANGQGDSELSGGSPAIEGSFTEKSSSDG